MSAAETIQAAIDKLQRQRDSYYSEGEEVWRAEHRDSDASRIFNQDDLMIAADVSALDADLIVTLHRTVDAQLSILRSALGDIARWLDPDSEYGWEPQDGPTPKGPAFEAKQALARAILEEAS